MRSGEATLHRERPTARQREDAIDPLVPIAPESITGRRPSSVDVRTWESAIKVSLLAPHDSSGHTAHLWLNDVLRSNSARHEDMQVLRASVESAGNAFMALHLLLGDGHHGPTMEHNLGAAAGNHVCRE